MPSINLANLATPTRAEAARFLSHATMGYTSAEVTDLVNRGYDAWLTSQFAIPNSKYPNHFDWLKARYPYTNTANNFEYFQVAYSSMRRITQGADGLRQKTVFALSQLLVTSVTVDLGEAMPQYAGAGYLDILSNQAFTNYRNLLQHVSRSRMMAAFLTFLGSVKATGTTVPDENFARELMQLFAIGVETLDGTTGVPVVNPSTGKAYEPYGRPQIRNLAKVFTGWRDNGAFFNKDTSYRELYNTANYDTYQTYGLECDINFHDQTESVLSFPRKNNGNVTEPDYVVTVPAGSDPLLRLSQAVDGIFNHPNVAFFVSRQLIQRFVTSNPSVAYVRNVADVFKATGGDMQAVIRAILLDESLFETNTAGKLKRTGGLNSATFGKIREPFARLTHWARAFNATSKSQGWLTGGYDGGIHAPSKLGQAPMHAPSVFNFYRPGYVSPGSATSKKTETLTDGSTNLTRPLVAPELQITDEVTTTAYVNFMQTAIDPQYGVNGQGDITANYAAWLTKANTPATLVAELKELLTADQLTDTNKTRVINAISSMPATTDLQRRQRVQAAILMIMASPEYIVQK